MKRSAVIEGANQMPAIRVPVAVHFDEADPQGVLFFGRVLTLAHRVFEDHLVPALVPRWEEWFLSREFAVPIRHAEAAFSEPMRPGHEYAAEIGIATIGRTSFQVRMRFVEAGEEERVCVETRVTHVFVDARTWIKHEIPPAIRIRLEALRTGTSATRARRAGTSRGRSVGSRRRPARA